MLVSNRGLPGVIPQVAKPVNVRPFFTNGFALPRSKAETGLASFRQVPGFSNMFLVLHQKGMIWKTEKTATVEQKTVFADITGEVFSERGPNGLQDVAFIQNFARIESITSFTRYSMKEGLPRTLSRDSSTPISTGTPANRRGNF